MLRCFFSFLIVAPINEINYFSCDSCQSRRLLRLLLLLHVFDGYRRPVASFVQTALICNSRFKLSQLFVPFSFSSTMLRCFFSFLIVAPINEINYFSCDSCQSRRLLRLLLLLHVFDGYRRPVASFVQTALICNSRFKLSQVLSDADLK
ncbi:hypothetical protein V6N13_129927 [Hibiscus sabdariffa]